MCLNRNVRELTYKTLHHTDVKECIITHRILAEIMECLDEIRGDMVGADTFNREMTEKIHSLLLFNKTNLLTIGETLQLSELKLTSEKYNKIADSYYDRDKEEMKDAIHFANKWPQQNVIILWSSSFKKE